MRVLYVPKSTDHDVVNYRLRGLIIGLPLEPEPAQQFLHKRDANVGATIYSRQKERKKISMAYGCCLSLPTSSIEPQEVALVSAFCPVLILHPLSHDIALLDLSRGIDAFQRFSSVRIKPVTFISP